MAFKRLLDDLFKLPITSDEAYLTLNDCLTAAREVSNGDKAGVETRTNLTGAILAMHEPVKFRIRSLKTRSFEIQPSRGQKRDYGDDEVEDDKARSQRQGRSRARRQRQRTTSGEQQEEPKTDGSSPGSKGTPRR